MTRYQEIPDNSLKLIDPARAEAIAKDVLSRVSAEAAVVEVQHGTSALGKFTRNDLRTVQNTERLQVILDVTVNGRFAEGITTRLDPAGIAAFVAETENAAKASQPGKSNPMRLPAKFTDPPIYFESSIQAGSAEARSSLLREAAASAESRGLIAAGDMHVEAYLGFVMNTRGFYGSTRSTYGEFSLSARTKDGKGSGWARRGQEDFSRIDPKALTDRAIDLCERSANPVAVEPGRYTVILEPEAVAELIDSITGSPTVWMGGAAAILGATVFSRKEGGTKLGLQMMDGRAQFLFDPMDKDLPFSPLGKGGWIFPRTYWHENGILKTLRWSDEEAERFHQKEVQNPPKVRLEITGQTTSLEEMIASTKRGIWVNRIHDVQVNNSRTFLETGTTRDGTFLIENGKITKAIKNLRFTESPFFILNKLDAFGPTVRASKGIAAPRLKVHDFEFTSLTDAI